jgi:hypothetical protein
VQRAKQEPPRRDVVESRYPPRLIRFSSRLMT